jgi:hypothetical protein
LSLKNSVEKSSPNSMSLNQRVPGSSPGARTIGKPLFSTPFAQKSPRAKWVSCDVFFGSGPRCATSPLFPYLHPFGTARRSDGTGQSRTRRRIGYEGCVASLTNRGFEARTHDIGSRFAQTERLASALNRRSTTTANRVAFVSLADRNDVDLAPPAVEIVPRRRHATIGLPGRDGSGRANIASP